MIFLAKHIHIVGLGLIGGSIGLGLRDLDYRVTGWDENPDHNELAREKEIVTEIVEPDQLSPEPEGIILAVPVPAMPEIVKKFEAENIRPGFYSDVGSTKSWIIDQLEGILSEGIPFVGAHPMAGSEQSGPAGADPLLFENAICVLTPTSMNDPAIDTVRTLWKDLGALVMEIDPLRHDRVASRVSHLPHIVAASLVHEVADLDGYEKDALPLAAGGFRDTTRIAEGDPDLWRDIIDTNQDCILESLTAYETIINELKSALSEGDGTRIEEFLERARDIRRLIPEKAKGMIGKLHELRLQAPDRPGVLAEITGILGKADINIVDIEVLKVREGEMGTIKLAFRDGETLSNARTCLQKNETGIKII